MSAAGIRALKRALEEAQGNLSRIQASDFANPYTERRCLKEVRQLTRDLEGVREFVPGPADWSRSDRDEGINYRDPFNVW